MAASSCSSGSYSTHTHSTKALVVEAELRHCWDLIRCCSGLLRLMDQHGGAGALGLRPREHYLLAKLVRDKIARFQKLLADNAHIWAIDDAERHERRLLREGALPALSAGSLPRWHRQTMAAVREFEESAEFVSFVRHEGLFDHFASADLVKVGASPAPPPASQSDRAHWFDLFDLGCQPRSAPACSLG